MFNNYQVLMSLDRFCGDGAMRSDLELVTKSIITGTLIFNKK